MRVVLNGAPRELPDGATVAEVVEAAGVPAGRRGIAVALDGEVVPRSAWEETRATDGASVEVLEARQGG